MQSKLKYLILIFFLIVSCSKEEIIYEPSKKTDPYVTYQEGLDAFKVNDFFRASKKFSEAELNFKIVEFAAKSAIMSSYALYGINFYEESLENLKRYIKKYPADKNLIYAHYLIAIIYFEQMNVFTSAIGMYSLIGSTSFILCEISDNKPYNNPVITFAQNFYLLKIRLNLFEISSTVLKFQDLI